MSGKLPESLTNDRLHKMFARIFVENEHEVLVAVHKFREHCTRLGVVPSEIVLLYGAHWRDDLMKALRMMAGQVDELQHEIDRLRARQVRRPHRKPGRTGQTADRTRRTPKPTSVMSPEEFQKALATFGPRGRAAAARVLGVDPRTVQRMAEGLSSITEKHVERLRCYAAEKPTAREEEEDQTEAPPGVSLVISQSYGSKYDVAPP